MKKETGNSKLETGAVKALRCQRCKQAGGTVAKRWHGPTLCDQCEDILSIHHQVAYDAVKKIRTITDLHVLKTAKYLEGNNRKSVVKALEVRIRKLEKEALS